MWNKAESMLKEAVDEMGLPYVEAIGKRLSTVQN